MDLFDLFRRFLEVLIRSRLPTMPMGQACQESMREPWPHVCLPFRRLVLTQICHNYLLEKEWNPMSQSQ